MSESINEAANSGITSADLTAKIIDKLQATHVDIQDQSGGCGQMYEAIIVSSLFENKMTLARHRLVNATLKEEIKAIHAWTAKCFTPEEWAKKQAGSTA
jgi:stress-induced morphogen